MKRKRFSVEQIVAVLKQAEIGVPVAELIRQVGIAEQTRYRWKKQYKGLETDQVRQFKQLQEENGRLKRLVGRADVGQDHASGCAVKKAVTPSRVAGGSRGG
jgi:putative transposase